MLSLVLTLSLAGAPQVALLSSAGSEAELRFQPLGATTLAPIVARFAHVEGSSVAGALLPGTRVVVATATLVPTRDPSFASGLVRLEPGQPARLLASGLAVGARPLVTAEGRVFVARGVAGPMPEDGRGALRVDALSVVEVSPDTGRLRPVYEVRGYVTHLAGALGRELVIYEVRPAGARLLAVHVDTLAVRVLLADLAPLARDFVVDALRRRVLFTQGDPSTHAWHVAALDLSTGTLARLAEGPDVALLPAVLPGGAVAVSPGPGAGLVVAGGARALPPQGEGYERLRAVHEGVAIGLHERPSAFPAPFAVELSTGEAVRLLAAPDARLDVAGVLP